MKTVYIDVYFLINFTIDILAIFIALRMNHVKIKMFKLIFSGILGGLVAIVELLIGSALIRTLIVILFLASVTLICCSNISGSRMLKFILSLYTATFLISGAVEFTYNLIDRYFDNWTTRVDTTMNRKAIVFSLIILLVIGVLRLFIMMFSELVSRKSVRLILMLNDRELQIDALLDTGNLVRDPMNMNPVIFIKKSVANSILPMSVIELSGLDSLSSEFKKRIRLIPITRGGETHVITGVRLDKVIILNEDGGRQEIDATIGIDKEEGTFGGYFALAPYVAFCND